MIERVYIDNYKCFVNFEVHPAGHPAHPGRQRQREDHVLRRPRNHPRFSDGGKHDEPELPCQHADGVG